MQEKNCIPTRKKELHQFSRHVFYNILLNLYYLSFYTKCCMLSLYKKSSIKNNNKTYQDIVRLAWPTLSLSWILIKTQIQYCFFLLSLVTLETAGVEKNLQEASKLIHKPVPNLRHLGSKICYQNSSSSAHGVTYKSKYIHLSSFSKWEIKRKAVFTHNPFGSVSRKFLCTKVT